MAPVVWITVGVGVLLSAVSLPLWRGWIRPNDLYGFRTPRLVTDPRVWYPANAIMGRDMFFAGIAVAVGMLALGAATPAGAEPALAPLLAVVLAPVLAAVLHGFYAASALVADLDNLTTTTTAQQATRRRTAAAAAAKVARLKG